MLTVFVEADGRVGHGVPIAAERRVRVLHLWNKYGQLLGSSPYELASMVNNSPQLSSCRKQINVFGTFGRPDLHWTDGGGCGLVRGGGQRCGGSDGVHDCVRRLEGDDVRLRGAVGQQSGRREANKFEKLTLIWPSE